MENVTINYRGVEIDVNVDYGMFNAVDNGEFGEFKSERMAEVKAWIDKKVESKARREKVEFKRIPVYVKRYSEIFAGEVTSIADGGASFWVSWIDRKGKKDRAKVSISDLYRLEPGTKIVFDRIQDRLATARKLETENRDDLHSLDDKARIKFEELAAYQDKEV
jgi:hypothetical protein